MLVGRARELDGLVQVLDGAANGRGGLRIVFGEPGIGKTRLADEIAERAAARGFQVVWGRAWETGGAPAYWPWIELLGPLVEEQPDVPASVTALVQRVASATRGDGTRADPARERFELFEAVTAFLRAAARRAPLLLVMDDLHAADVASLELLSFVARGLRTSRMAIVATYRDAESRMEPVAEVLARIAREGDMFPLRPLSGEEVAEVVRHDVGHFDGPLSAALFEMTEGNPLFLHEMLQVIAADARHAPMDALKNVQVAGGVLSLVRGRLASADDGLRGLLEAAAVTGREVSLSLVAEISGLPSATVLAFLEDAKRRGLLASRGENRFVFSHVLVREAFYQELPDAARCELHGKVASALRLRVDRGEVTHLPMLAHHALAALPVGDPLLAIRTACVAAERARNELAYEEATALLERSLAVCERFSVPDRERVEIELALGWASTEAGRTERGRDLFRDAARRARGMGDAPLFARAALGQGGEYVLAEIRGELVDVLREALVMLGEPTHVEHVRLKARVLARLAAALTPSATPEEPLGLARQALAMTSDETDARTRIDVDVGVGAAYTDFARPEERIPVNERLLRDARAVGDRVLRLRALTRLSCDHLERGDVQSADSAIAARAALSDSLGHPRYLWQTPLLRSMRAMPEGRFADCEAEIEAARKIASEVSDPNAERCIELHLFTMLLVAGRPEELRAQRPAALRVVGSLPSGDALTHWVNAVISSRLGEHREAVRALAALGTTNMLTARMGRVTLAEAAVMSNVPEVYNRLYRTFTDGEEIASWGPFAFACATPIARVLGAIAFAQGNRDEAVRHCERAIALTERMEASAHGAWAHLTLGEGLSRNGSGARPHLTKARELGEKLRMPEVVARADAALDQSEAPRSTREPGAARHDATKFSMRREGGEWSVEHAGHTFRLKDVRGLGMLERLVTAPNQEIHALDLASDGSADGSAAIDLGDAGSVIDARAREAYRKRIAELREEVAEAERFADTGRAEQLRYELDALTDQIAAAVGLGGRERRSGSAAERARIVVQRRVREAIKKIADVAPDLGRHLDWTVRTGTFCAYEPDGRRPR